jgi:hypothetical protein
LPFQGGKRRVLIGHISDDNGHLQLTVPDPSSQVPALIAPAEIDSYLDQLAAEITRHGLELSRGDPNLSDVFVVQSLRHDSSRDLSWMREASVWVGHITTIGLEMVLPGIAGQWLDQRLNTRFLGPLGFLLGLTLAVLHLRQLGRKRT